MTTTPPDTGPAKRSVSIPAELHDRLTKAADDRCVGKNLMATTLLAQGLDRLPSLEELWSDTAPQLVPTMDEQLMRCEWTSPAPRPRRCLLPVGHLGYHVVDKCPHTAAGLRCVLVWNHPGPHDLGDSDD